MAQHEPVLRAVAVFYAAAGGILTPPCGERPARMGEASGQHALSWQYAAGTPRTARRLIAHLC